MSEIVVARDIAELNLLAAERFVTIAAESTDARGRFTAALSGGSTPKALFRLLASEPCREAVDWDTTVFFFGDERNVPADSEDSNYRMANESLFRPLGIRQENVHRWKTELGGPGAAAADYENEIRSVFGTGIPVFDLVFLGMGTDGHTASLFPGTAALDEKNRIAVANPVPKLDTVRLTLTYPVFNAASNVMFLIAGADKAAVLAHVLGGDEDLRELPSSGIRPASGNLYWYLDEAAATELPR